MLKPEKYFVSVLDIDADELVGLGYRAVLLDLDNTILPRDEQRVPAPMLAWVQSLVDAGLRVAIVTNTNNDRVAQAAHDLNVHLVRNAFKPFTKGYVIACACLGVPCNHALMVGDQSYTDVLGAHRVGMDAYMVMPLNSADPMHTYLMRIVDKVAVRGMRAAGSKS